MSSWEFSEEVRLKARSYLEQDRVQVIDGGPPGRYLVQGSAAQPYKIHTNADPRTKTASWIECSCPHGANQGAGAAFCSHAVAVIIAIVEETPLPRSEVKIERNVKHG